MGASGWQHFVPYEPDLDLALQHLREDVFRRGAFYGKKGAESAPTIEAVLEGNGEDGTHSALDVHRIATEPLPTSALAWHAEALAATGAPPPPEALHARLLAEAEFWGAVAPLSEEELVERFGSGRPDHATVERASGALMSNILRGCGVYVFVWKDPSAPRPSEIFFAGVTGD